MQGAASHTEDASFYLERDVTSGFHEHPPSNSSLALLSSYKYEKRLLLRYLNRDLINNMDHMHIRVLTLINNPRQNKGV